MKITIYQRSVFCNPLRVSQLPVLNEPMNPTVYCRTIGCISIFAILVNIVILNVKYIANIAVHVF